MASGALKLQNIGNSLGFRLPKEALSEAKFKKGDSFELIVKDGIVIILKKKPHHSLWKFTNKKGEDKKAEKEDRVWLEQSFEEDKE